MLSAGRTGCSLLPRMITLTRTRAATVSSSAVSRRAARPLVRAPAASEDKEPIVVKADESGVKVEVNLSSGGGGGDGSKSGGGSGGGSGGSGGKGGAPSAPEPIDSRSMNQLIVIYGGIIWVACEIHKRFFFKPPPPPPAPPAPVVTKGKRGKK